MSLIVCIIDFSNKNVGFISLVSACLVATVTIVYVIITAKILKNTKKATELSIKPSLIISFDSYKIGYYEDNGDMNIDFKFLVTIWGIHMAFNIYSALKCNIDSTPVLKISEKQESIIHSTILNPYDTSNKSRFYSFNCKIQKDLLNREKLNFNLDYKLEYQSQIGIKYSENYKINILIKIPERSMLGSVETYNEEYHKE